jgi:hypothetical protein
MLRIKGRRVRSLVVTAVVQPTLIFAPNRRVRVSAQQYKALEPLSKPAFRLAVVG